MKGEISTDLLMNAYDIILHEERLKELRDGLCRYTAEGLALVGLEANVLTDCCEEESDMQNEHNDINEMSNKPMPIRERIKPRDTGRMYGFLEQVRLAWAKEPDLRFGQLLNNFFAQAGDPFYWEEDEFAARLNAYMERNINN